MSLPEVEAAKAGYRFLVRPLALCGLAAVLFFAGYAKGCTDGRDKEVAKAKTAREKAAAVRQAVEDSWRAAHYQLAWDAEVHRREREQETERLIADVRTGAIRVRPRFTCPGLPTNSAAIPIDSEGGQGGLQREDVEFLLRLAGEADKAVIQLHECQGYARSLANGG